MYSHHIKLFFIVMPIMLAALLNGCSQPGYHAPLSSYNFGILTENRKTEKKQPIKTAPAPTKKINSPPKNSFIPSYKKSQPNYRSPYTQPKSTPPARKSGSNSQKKSIISIDNEIMLKLNFQWPIKGKIVKIFLKPITKGLI